MLTQWAKGSQRRKLQRSSSLRMKPAAGLFPLCITCLLKFCRLPIASLLSTTDYRLPAFNLPIAHCKLLLSLMRGRRTYTATAAFQYAADQRQTHKARTAGAEIPACTGLSLQTPRQQLTRQTRPRITQIQNRHLHTRLLLARPQQLQVLYHSQNKNGVVDRKNCEEQNQ